MDWKEFFTSEIESIQAYTPGLREEQILEIAQTPHIHKLSSNESPYPPFPSALAAMQESLIGLNTYCDGSSYELRQGLSKQYQVPYEQIMVGNGTNQLLMYIAQTCLTPEDRIAYCWPSFSIYRLVAQIAGATYDEVSLTSYGSFDLEALLEAITPQTKIVFISSPTNPTGGIVTQEECERFMARVPEHVLVVFDMAYKEFVTDPNHVAPMSFYDGKRPVIVLNTFSKIYGLAGVRVGYGFAPEPMGIATEKVRAPFNVNSVAQAGALACIGQDEELARRREDNALQRARLCEGFDRLGLKYYESHANFVWVFVPDSAQTFEQLLRRGIIVRSFAAGGGLRVGVGNEDDTLATLAAFEQIFSDK